ncbi:ABC-F family ATP-binding cassette domain-containing protein [Streptomyces marincola]|uniref:ABC-F family ATP-binding cassette domain-containing protein n=1 Tax=Streptomyces marincola TaxID=2878388 RepID=UPI001CF127BB|nr:ABC-F family ATP-binding cassette domain-containing protein [Streptomyces marincola]UCM87886.1 ATP-binding cassette domain-containing protein [Streptomyces marincola]
MHPTALTAHDLVRLLGARRVLDGVSLTAAPGHRIGLIGENGAGKSTLLRLLAGADQPDAGTVERPARLGYLRQEMPFDGSATIADVLDDALREARADLAALDRLAGELAAAPQDSPEHAAALAAYGERLERAERHEVWDADRRAGVVLAGLGLGGVPHARTLASLSGGQRARLALAALLTRRPDALLLDEPTNHLDDDAAAFLEGQLRAFPGVLVAASHDRAFLDAVCTDIVDLDPAPGGPTRYGGTYSDYRVRQLADRERWRRQYADEQERITALRRAVSVTAPRVAPGRAPRDSERMGYDHSGGRVQNQIARRVRNAARRLAELERAQVPEPPEPLRLRTDALTAEAGDGTLVALRHVRVPGRLAVDRLDVRSTERLLVTGRNGAGKSTLLAVLAGHLAASGEVRRRRGLTVGLLAQDTAFGRPERTARATYELALGPERAAAVPLRTLGLLDESAMDRAVGELSVGQRRRLALALLVARPPQLLLLDEPTNHLSPALADELTEALGPGPGAVVVTGHDRRLRARWQGAQLALCAPGARAGRPG